QNASTLARSSGCSGGSPVGQRGGASPVLELEPARSVQQAAVPPAVGRLFRLVLRRPIQFAPPRPRLLRQPRQRQYQHTQQQPSENSRAPPPKKAEAKDEQTGPTTSIVVMGDDMADWLASGLEDVFSDTPEISVVRKNKLNSGLLHYDAKADLDWWHVARDTLAQKKVDYVVMMLGLSDRQAIREKDLVKETDTKAKDQQAKDQAAKDPQPKNEAEKKSGQKPAKTNDT